MNVHIISKDPLELKGAPSRIVEVSDGIEIHVPWLGDWRAELVLAVKAHAFHQWKDMRSDAKELANCTERALIGPLDLGGLDYFAIVAEYCENPAKFAEIKQSLEEARTDTVLDSTEINCQ